MSDLSSSIFKNARSKNLKSSMSPTNGWIRVCSIASVLPSDFLVANISTPPSIRLSTQSLSASAHDKSSYAERNASMNASSGLGFVGIFLHHIEEKNPGLVVLFLARDLRRRAH